MCSSRVRSDPARLGMECTCLLPRPRPGAGSSPAEPMCRLQVSSRGTRVELMWLCEWSDGRVPVGSPIAERRPYWGQQKPGSSASPGSFRWEGLWYELFPNFLLKLTPDTRRRSGGPPPKRNGAYLGRGRIPPLARQRALRAVPQLRSSSFSETTMLNVAFVDERWYQIR